MSSNLGDSTTPSSGTWTDQRASATQFWIGNTFAMPAGGGTVTDFYWYGRSVSGTGNFKPCIWGDTGSGNTLIWSGSQQSVNTTMGWQHQSVPNIFVAAGNIHLGVWAPGTVDLEWEVAPAGTNGGVFFEVVGSPSNLSGGQDEYNGGGEGCFACYITYNPGGGMYVNTGTPAAPVWTPAAGVFINTGTPAAPVWTQASQVAANTGTPASPVWTPGS